MHTKQVGRILAIACAGIFLTASTTATADNTQPVSNDVRCKITTNGCNSPGGCRTRMTIHTSRQDCEARKGEIEEEAK